MCGDELPGFGLRHFTFEISVFDWLIDWYYARVLGIQGVCSSYPDVMHAVFSFCGSCVIGHALLSNLNLRHLLCQLCLDCVEPA